MGHITLTSTKTRSNPTRKSQLLDFVSLIFFGIVILFVLLIFTPLGDSLAASGNQALIKSNLAYPKQRGWLIALIESKKYGKVVDVCVNGDVDYMPCEDPTRNSVLSREMNFYRERQCPGVDERAVFLVPAPSGYWVPIQWPESLHKEQIHIQIELISDVVPRAKMDIWWRLRRGGMDAKVKAAAKAAYSGTPIVISSGFTSNNIIKVLNGERVGTLFHKDSHMWIPVTEVGPHELAVSAREASRRLQVSINLTLITALTSEERRKILLDVAVALEANEQFITLENDADVETAREARYDESLVARLALKPSKIRALAESVRRLADMEEPIGHVLKRT